MKTFTMSSLVFLIVAIAFVAGDKVCPKDCETCQPGGEDDGGKALNSNNTCEYFCSKGGYCGDEDGYKKDGVNCSVCKEESSSTICKDTGNCTNVIPKHCQIFPE